MVITGIFSSSSKFSVNPLLAVYFPSCIHVAAFILYSPAEVPEQQKATAGEVHKAPGLSASYCSNGWSGTWRHNWKHWGMSHRTVHGT